LTFWASLPATKMPVAMHFAPYPVATYSFGYWDNAINTTTMPVSTGIQIFLFIGMVNLLKAIKKKENKQGM